MGAKQTLWEGVGVRGRGPGEAPRCAPRILPQAGLTGVTRDWEAKREQGSPVGT